MKATANALLLLPARARGHLLFFRVGVLLTLTLVLTVLYAGAAWGANGATGYLTQERKRR